MIQSSLFKEYPTKPGCSAINEKMFWVLSVITLFTAK